jgi:hypothetical protein
MQTWTYASSRLNEDLQGVPRMKDEVEGPTDIP